MRAPYHALIFPYIETENSIQLFFIEVIMVISKE
ncbi:hypothetical protein M2166_001244 [Bacillus sp. TBS-096]|nr:hypothetical protein [Bacillus sp. TBS-096]